MDEQNSRSEDVNQVDRTTRRFQNIDQLSDEDAAMIRETEDYYLAAMLNTSPCDRERAEHAVDKLQRASGLVPSKYIWFDSPYKASIAVLLLACYSSLSKPVKEGPFSSSKRQYREASKRALERGRESLEPQNPPIEPSGRLRASPTDNGIETRVASMRLASQKLTRVGHLSLAARCIQFTIFDDISHALESQDTMEDWLDTWSQLTEHLRDQSRRYMPQLISANSLRHSLTGLQTSLDDFAGFINRLGSTGQHSALEVCVADCMANLGAPCSRAIELKVETILHCGWWWVFREVCILSERQQEICFDETFRPHNFDGPAVRYGDGWGACALRGIGVPEFVIKGDFNAQDIENESNLERRRVMIDKYGLEKYIKELGLTPIQQDDFGILYRKSSPVDEPIVVVEVVNSTPEPDGTMKRYFLRVDPQVKTAREAVAWTFDMDEEEYSPAVQT